jgi:hypothetical protein
VPRTFVNTETHCWDASQIYGSTQQFEDAARRPTLGPGKVAIGADGLIDIDPSLLGSSDGLYDRGWAALGPIGAGNAGSQGWRPGEDAQLDATDRLTDGCEQ